MRLGEKLKKVRVEHGYSMEDLKNLLNEKYDLQISKSMISRWENGTSEPVNTNLAAYAKEFHLDMNDLLDIDHRPDVIVLKKTKKLPILGTIICGQPIMSYENYEGYIAIDADIVQGDFVLRAEGDSMIDAGIHEGDYVIFKKTPQVENGAIAAVLIEDKMTLKKFYKKESSIILQPANSTYEPIIISDNDNKGVQIIGEMTGVYSKRNK